MGTAVALAAAIKTLNADLVVTGTQSTDAISGDLPGMLAEKLGLPGLTYARKVEVADGRVRVERETDTGYMTISAAAAGPGERDEVRQRAALPFAQRHHGRQEKDDHAS